MAFVKRDVKDQVVQYPNRYKVDGVSKIVEPDFGTVTEAGTPINKEYLQRLEDRLAELVSSRVQKTQLCFAPSVLPANRYIRTPTIGASNLYTANTYNVYVPISATRAITLVLNSGSADVRLVDIASGSAIQTINTTAITKNGSYTNCWGYVVADNKVFICTQYGTATIYAALVTYNPTGDTISLKVSGQTNLNYAGGISDEPYISGAVLSANGTYVILFYTGYQASSTYICYAIFNVSGGSITGGSSTYYGYVSGDNRAIRAIPALNSRPTVANPYFLVYIGVTPTQATAWTSYHGLRMVSIESGAASWGTRLASSFTSENSYYNAMAVDVGEQILVRESNTLIGVYSKASNTVTRLRGITLPHSITYFYGTHSDFRKVYCYAGTQVKLTLDGVGNDMTILSELYEGLQNGLQFDLSRAVGHNSSASTTTVPSSIMRPQGTLYALAASHAEATGITEEAIPANTLFYPPMFY